MLRMQRLIRNLLRILTMKNGKHMGWWMEKWVWDSFIVSF